MNVCCSDPMNRVAGEGNESLTVSVCKVCARRHFELSVEPAKVGVRVG
jgi:hypothetical protein